MSDNSSLYRSKTGGDSFRSINRAHKHTQSTQTQNMKQHIVITPPPALVSLPPSISSMLMRLLPWAYFKYKKKSLLLLLLLLLMRVGQAEASYYCTGKLQQNITDSIPACKVRETVVDLRPFFYNRTDVIQVIPSHAVVNSCAGGCYLPHSCQSAASTPAKVEVMIVLDKWPYGKHEVLCSEVWLQEDQECHCACTVRAEHCIPGKQYYDTASCSCVCGDYEARSRCLLRNMVWDPTSCSCSCPSHTFQPCSTGYVFDLTHSCKCIQIYLVASEGLIAALVIIVAALSLTLITGYLMYRTQTGLFRNRKGSPPEVTLRTRLMTQKSRSEFDLLSTNLKLSLKEYDERKVESQLEPPIQK